MPHRGRVGMSEFGVRVGREPVRESSRVAGRKPTGFQQLLWAFPPGPCSRRLRGPCRQTQPRMWSLGCFEPMEHTAAQQGTAGWQRDLTGIQSALPVTSFSRGVYPQRVLFVNTFKAYLSALASHPNLSQYLPHYHVYSYSNYQ